MDEQDLLDVAGRLCLDHDALRAVRRAGVGVDQDRAQVREVLHKAGLSGADHMADRRRIPEARNADHDVGATEPGDLVPELLELARSRASAPPYHVEWVKGTTSDVPPT